MTPEPATYPGYRFPAEIISHAVWLYHCFSLSLRDVELILAERGIKRHPEPIQGRHREPIHLRYCDAPAIAGAGVALSSPERRFSRNR